ncbi:replication protein A 70 kDa DNA-binding subunit A [Striga asiatica]|uniref:Replication protein A 70 kDa DNA-binding subunit A n=1 Tax=Striga asiatica TaxID=4170 RepID=A0A5A7QQ10_STRAF|nr:replication protein A 70 kDa DNA-binding subunit A [Striga asiatica]
MSRIYLPIKEITEATNTWTALIQVVERPPVHQSKNDSTMHYRRYLFTDEEGTKVATVVYNTVIDEFAPPLLMPYKRYYVSGAKVRPEIPLYQVGDYKYKCILVKGTNVEDYEEPLPPQLPCSIEIHPFAILHNYADTENPRSLLAVVVHAFPKRTVGANTTRELIVINEEMKPMILTLWNQFEKDDGPTLTNNIAAANIVLAMRSRVTTFHGLSLSTKVGTCLMVNPPIPAAADLKQWYIQNKKSVAKLIDEEAYKDTNKLYPWPEINEITTVQKAVTSLKYGQDLKGEIEALMEKHSVICFIKYTESAYHTILKLYTVDRMNTETNMLEEQLSKKDTASSSSTQLFTPTLKNVLQSVAMKIEKDPSIGNAEPLAKKRINFESQPTASSSITTATPSKQASPKPSQPNLETHKDLPASPSKKSRPKMD